MKRVLLAVAVMCALGAQCAAPKAKSSKEAPAPQSVEDVEPPFKPVVVDVEGVPAEGLFNYNFWRILSSVEKTNGTHRICKMWKDATACQVIPDGCESDMQVLELKDGRYYVDWTLTVTSTNLPPLPRVGLSFPLRKTFTTVRWNGRGPWENYPDRRNGAKLGIYAADMALVGESNFGYRTACRWVEIEEPMGRGMRIEAVNAPFGFSIRPRTDNAPGFFVNIDAYISEVMSLMNDLSRRGGTYRLSFLMSEL